MILCLHELRLGCERDSTPCKSAADSSIVSRVDRTTEGHTDIGIPVEERVANDHVSSAAPASVGMASGHAVIEVVKELNKSPQVGNITARSDTTLKSRLQQLVDSKLVLLFMKGTPDQPRCGFSRKVVDVLKELGVEFGSFDILSDEEVREGMKSG